MGSHSILTHMFVLIGIFPISLLILNSKLWPYIPNLARLAVKGQYGII